MVSWLDVNLPVSPFITSTAGGWATDLYIANTKLFQKYTVLFIAGNFTERVYFL